MALESQKIRKEFPILESKIHDKTLVYLDSAATTLRPRSVVEGMAEHDLMGASNVHRGVHYLSDQATTKFEASRQKIAGFLNAGEDEVVLTHGTTESLNLLAHGLAGVHLKPGDEILLTALEHHSNIVPWQMAAERSGAIIKAIPINAEGQLDMAAAQKLISKKTKILSFTAVSNTIGTITPRRRLTEMAREVGALIVIDAAQAVANMKVDVKAWDCDFLAFSAHKLFGPTGVGVLYGKRDWLERLPPFLGGGAMIEKVTLERSTYLKPPFRFEAGTPDITGVIGLGYALDFLASLDLSAISKHENELVSRTIEGLKQIGGLRILGPTSGERGPIVSFVVEGAHHQDLGSLLDREGVAVRTGHHCTQPLMESLGVLGTVRASFSIYSQQSDVDRLLEGLNKALRILGN